jgi:uncharacterized protein
MRDTPDYNDMKLHASFFWRKLDHPGHDSCRLFRSPEGWLLRGAAVFVDNKRHCHLNYELVADSAWKTRRAEVCGFVGSNAVKLRIRSSSRLRWFTDGVEQEKVAGCMDLDLGFTPATNLIAIRRLALKVGQSAQAPAAYLAFPKMRLERLEQSYHRTGPTTFEYTAPRFGYAGTLEVGASGAVASYPGLFEQVLPSKKRVQPSAA